MDFPALTAVTRRNFLHLYADSFWYGVQSGSHLAFLAIFAARLGASSFEISLLTAGPALVNFAFSLPTGRWLQGRDVIPATFWASVAHRLFILALIPLPLWWSNSVQIWGVVLITLVMAIPATLLSIGFNAMFAELTPPDFRSLVVGRRNAILALSLTGTVLGCGLLLDRLPFPLNYQLVFSLGALGAGMSTLHLGLLRAPDGHAPLRVNRLLGDWALPGMRRVGDALRTGVGLRFLLRRPGAGLRLDLIRGRTGRFMLAFLIFYIFQTFPAPLFPLVTVRVLKLTDGQISLGSGIFYLVMLLFSLQLARLTRRWGHHRMLAISAMLYSLYPLLLGLARQVEAYWVASAVGGAVWALLNAALLNRLMEITPEYDRPAYMALHNLALNGGILLGSLSGPALGELLGLQEAVLIGAGLRFAAGLLLLRWG
jgi:hypothetical protein